MIPTAIKSPYSYPELKEVIVVPRLGSLATTSIENKNTETINNDPTEHDWD